MIRWLVGKAGCPEKSENRFRLPSSVAAVSAAPAVELSSPIGVRELSLRFQV
jgi:hypothetical protein